MWLPGPKAERTHLRANTQVLRFGTGSIDGAKAVLYKLRCKFWSLSGSSSEENLNQESNMDWECDLVHERVCAELQCGKGDEFDPKKVANECRDGSVTFDIYIADIRRLA